ncbi:GPW/gp25 family protein [Sphingomonas sp. LB-2]|uniref:GPW/gp25 family protein n=1 Tax=Sphingomonas caeni TaxID=2984949 RepID=UPI00222EE5F6|nr:GPW/gp25 family protein [Sphingomonas caeni]MCW3846494.1 GPW/gp25 family protein [Sphingomonas caeni]
MTTVSPPYRFLRSGRTALDEDDGAIRDLIRQILFTMPGERVNRAEFGSAITGQVFAGNSEMLAAAAQATAQASLQRYLGDRIVIEAVEVHAVDAALTVEVVYASRRTGSRGRARITGTAA